MPILQSARWTFRASSGAARRICRGRHGDRRTRLVVLNTLVGIDEHRFVACDDLDCRSLARSEQRWGCDCDLRTSRTYERARQRRTVPSGVTSADQ